MCIKVNILENGEGIEILATEVVTGREIIQAMEEKYDNAHISKQKYHIIDKSKCTEYNVTSQDVQSIANFDIKASEINPHIVMAVIESEYLQFSLTKLWQKHIEDYVFKTKSFVNRKAALEWIEKNKK